MWYHGASGTRPSVDHDHGLTRAQPHTDRITAHRTAWVKVQVQAPLG
jgi:hypothetical protein